MLQRRTRAAKLGIRSLRYVIFVVLVSVPLAVIGWVAWRGYVGPPPEQLALETRGTSAPETKIEPVPSPPPPRTRTATSALSTDAALKALFAAPLAGARVKGEVELYDSSRLYDYIDGAAPLYLERKFRLLAGAEMALDGGGGELTLDVYDMTDAEHARAIADVERSPAAKAVTSWPEAWSGPMAFVFHRDRYYVKLTAFDAGAEASLPALARAVVERMP
ncbi:MAG: hypothetical protein IT384_28765 [Deltaproteobacteria bacterium]|nr:hypothetical protein [Deltaproteobacteria bacterium]